MGCGGFGFGFGLGFGFRFRFGFGFAAAAQAGCATAPSRVATTVAASAVAPEAAEAAAAASAASAERVIAAFGTKTSMSVPSPARDVTLSVAPILSARARIPASPSKPGIEGYGFWDHAWVHNYDRLTVIPGPEHLDSIGGGARISFSRFALDAALAIPLNRAGIDNRKPSPRLLISLTTRLWPWSYR